MTHFIFKSANRLIKNESIHFKASLSAIQGQLKIIQAQNRYLRQDLVDVKLMLNKLLIDKHLQMQVDEYFETDGSAQDPPELEDK